MTDFIEKTNISTSPDGCMAYIVGPNHFQNTLLAAYIETHSKGKSAVVSSIASVAIHPGSSFFGHTAVLYDCFGKHSHDLPATLLAELEQLPPEWTLALFNLDRFADIEKKALEFGVKGVFYQDDSVETLLNGLTVMFGGEFWVSRHNLAQIVLENGFGLRRRQLSEQGYPNDLTHREVEILGLLTLGATNRIISDKLFISPHTVRTHLNHIFKKIKVESRLKASLWAAESLFGSLTR